MDADPGELSDHALLLRLFASSRRMEMIMSALSDSLDRLASAIRDKIAALEAALAAERAAAQATAEQEAAEDVVQNQELADARAATDAALGEVTQAVTQVDALTQEVSTAPEVSG